ncbi:RNA 2'-phosphotransferase, tpt1 / kptA family protein [Hirsutella rhossiliensis]|uniref:2'-phosphotransferase n=1 Tax=Hirsutella rhossiliensis TaxID=111463 RepID=A0A9P8MVM5_9HYPO|nr:RNA 2'-phosphotransferase, tpt1 / kptA family domain-containing protein [Hirsutella rhossiliensis]KAH0963023.1 RNA 2'-phosphotransferase, tpt1 / kptA family domain-containing protein [Hirsutella rhossiliensis]
MADSIEPGGNSEGMARLALEDRVCDEAAKSRERKGGRGGAAKSGGGTGQGRDVQVSRTLSRLLRHQAERAGIKLDGEGFAPLDKVLAWGPLRSLKVTLADVQSLVATNDKQRFSLKLNPETTNPDPSTAGASAADYLVRANQGHSIKLDSSTLLEPITLEDVPLRVLHGTYFAFWPAIEAAGGLKPMGRNHVHCSTGDPDDSGEGGPAVVSGMRRDAELVIEIDVEGSLREGVKWWRSDNGVVLTEGNQDGGLLSTRFFKKVTGRKMDVGVLWEDGEKKADLPAGIKGRGHGNKTFDYTQGLLWTK